MRMNTKQRSRRCTEKCTVLPVSQSLMSAVYLIPSSPRSVPMIKGRYKAAHVSLDPGSSGQSHDTISKARSGRAYPSDLQPCLTSGEARHLHSCYASVGTSFPSIPSNIWSGSSIFGILPRPQLRYPYADVTRRDFGGIF